MIIFLKQVITMTKGQIKSRYRKTWAGFLWVISAPIFTYLVQSFIFQELFKFNIQDYPLYLVSGLLPWLFISQSIIAHTSTLVVSRDILLAFKLNPLVIVVSNVLDQFISFFSVFIILFLFLVPNFLASDHLGLKFLFIGINFVLIFSFVSLLTFLLSFWHAFYRDIGFIMQFILGLMFYLTPIFYLQENFPYQYNFLLRVNLFLPFIKIFQYTLYQWSVEFWVKNALMSLICVGCLGGLSFLSFKRKKQDFYINV